MVDTKRTTGRSSEEKLFIGQTKPADKSYRVKPALHMQ